jgi:hypothetical protein
MRKQRWVVLAVLALLLVASILVNIYLYTRLADRHQENIHLRDAADQTLKSAQEGFEITTKAIEKLPDDVKKSISADVKNP